VSEFEIVSVLFAGLMRTSTDAPRQITDRRETYVHLSDAT